MLLVVIQLCVGWVGDGGGCAQFDKTVPPRVPPQSDGAPPPSEGGTVLIQSRECHPPEKQKRVLYSKITSQNIVRLFVTPKENWQDRTMGI